MNLRIINENKKKDLQESLLNYAINATVYHKISDFLTPYILKIPFESLKNFLLKLIKKICLPINKNDIQHFLDMVIVKKNIFDALSSIIEFNINNDNLGLILKQVLCTCISPKYLPSLYEERVISDPNIKPLIVELFQILYLIFSNPTFFANITLDNLNECEFLIPLADLIRKLFNIKSINISSKDEILQKIKKIKKSKISIKNKIKQQKIENDRKMRRDAKEKRQTIKKYILKAK